MNLTKAFYLDENYKFPQCNVCKKELSPYCVTSVELNECSVDKIKMLIQCKLLRINAVEEDKHVLFLCKNCVQIKEYKNE